MAKKKLKVPFQGAEICPQNELSVCISGRFEPNTFPFIRPFLKQLDDLLDIWNSAFRWTFMQKMKYKTADSKLNTVVQKKFGLKKRVAGAMINNVKTILKAYAELRQTQITEHLRKIESLQAEIEELNQEIAVLRSSCPNWAKPGKGQVQELRKLKAMRAARKMRLNRFRQRTIVMQDELESGYKFAAKAHRLACGMKAAFSVSFLLIFNIYILYSIRVNRKGFHLMGRPKSGNVQVNISIPAEWKEELENLARVYSVEEGQTVTFLELMRRGIQEKYQLGQKSHE